MLSRHQWMGLGVGAASLITVALVAPFAMSFVAEKDFKQFIKQLPASPQVKMNIQSYQRGWFQSTATVLAQVEYPVAKQLLKTTGNQNVSFSMLLTENIHHGPILRMQDEDGKTRLNFGVAGIETIGQFDQSLQNMIAKQLEGSIPPFKATSLIKFGGEMTTWHQMPPFTLKTKDATQSINFAGMKGEWSVGPHLSRLDGTMNFAGFSVKGPRAEVGINNVQLKYQQTKQKLDAQNHTLWTGNASFNMPEFKVSAQGKNQFSVQDLSVNTDSHVSNNLFDVNADATINKIVIDNATYGPGRYVGSIKQIDAVALSELHQQMQALQDPSLSQEQKRAILMSALPMWVKLFDKGANLQLQTLEFMTPDGMLHAKGELKFPTPPVADTKDPNAATAAMNPLASLSKISLDIAVNLPIPLAQKGMQNFYVSFYRNQQTMMQRQAMMGQQPDQTASMPGVPGNPPAPTAPMMKSDQEILSMAQETAKNQLRQWVTVGMLIEQNGKYDIHVTYQGGQLLVNGKPPAPANLQNAMQPTQPTMPVATTTPSPAMNPQATAAPDNAAVPAPTAAASQSTQNIAAPTLPAPGQVPTPPSADAAKPAAAPSQSAMPEMPTTQPQQTAQ